MSTDGIITQLEQLILQNVLGGSNSGVDDPGPAWKNSSQMPTISEPYNELSCLDYKALESFLDIEDYRRE